VAPSKKINGYSATIDICADFEKSVLTLNPSWNLTNYCEQYFCTNSTPYFMNHTNFGAIGGAKLDPANAHTSMHRLCSQCSATVNQSFSSMNVSKCKWFDTEYCNNVCVDSTCVYFEETMSICYVSEIEQFLFRNDGTHRGLVWLYIYYTSILVFILSVVELMVSFVMLVIPEIVHGCRKCTDPMKSAKQKVVSNFTWRGIMITILVITLLVNLILCFLDMAQQMAQDNLFGGRYRNFANVITVVIQFAIELFLFIQWYSVYRRSTAAKAGLGPYRIAALCLIMVALVFWGILGAIFYLIGSMTSSQAAFILLGIWSIGSGIMGIIILILLLVYSIKILRLLTNVSDSSQSNIDKATKVLNVRLTRFMIALSISLFWLIFFAIVMGLQFAIGLDVFSIQFHFVFNCLINLVLMGVLFVIIIGLSGNFWCKKGETKADQ
jgi:uncharacterized membrane protein